LAGFLTGLGLWFSAGTGSGAAAGFRSLLAVAVVLLGTALAAYQVAGSRLHPLEAAGMVPPVALVCFAFSPEEFMYAVTSATTWRGWVLDLELASWYAAACVLWWAATVRFREVTGRMPSLPTAASPATQPGALHPHVPARVSLTAMAQRAVARIRLRSCLQPQRLVQAGLLLLPLGALLAWYVRDALIANERLHAAFAEADRLDPGWRLDEGERGRMVNPPVYEAARLIKKTLRARRGELITKEFQQAFYTVLAPERLLDEHRITLLRTELAREQAALNEARLLADIPAGRPPVSSGIAQAPLHLDLREGRSVIDLLIRDVKLRSQEKDGDGALAGCRGIVHAARAYGTEGPTLLGMLVQVAYRGLALREIEHILAQTEPPEPALAALQHLLEDENQLPLLPDAMRSQRRAAERQLRAVQDGLIDPAVEAAIMQRYDRNRPRLPSRAELTNLLSGSLTHQRARMLHDFNTLVEIARLPDYQQHVRLAQFTALSSTITYLSRYMHDYHRDQVMLRCAILALAVERYRRQNGAWPASAADLVPGQLERLPLDPEDGQPVRYVRLPDGVVVYCLGWDGKDDGGAVRSRTPPIGGSDVGYRLWDVARRRQPAVPPPNRGTGR
jgi:hypothetical protein